MITPQQYNHRHCRHYQAFTLVELLVVIVIIGILATLATVFVANARVKSRDSRRVADLRTWQNALELYYADVGSYPQYATPGNTLVSPADATKVYLTIIPHNPAPYSDNGCPNNDYTYSQVNSGNNYTINFCLGLPSGSQPSGVNVSSEQGVGIAPGLVGWWKLDGNANDSSGNGNNGTVTGATLTADKG